MPAPVQISPEDAAPEDRRRADNLVAAGWILLAGVAATAMTIAVRYLSEDLDSRMIAHLRCLFGLALLAPWLFARGSNRLSFTLPWLHLLRGVLTGFALNMGFFAIGALEITTATILFFLAPIFATALAGPMLGERVGPRRWGAVAAGFLGALIILRPGVGELEWGMAAAIGSAAAFSISLLLSKRMTAADGARSVLASTVAVAAVVTFPIALPVWSYPETWVIWTWLGVLILSSTLRMYADIRGYALGEAGFIAPFNYARLIFIAAAGWLLFAEAPDAYALLGGAVITAATLYIAHREARLNKRIAGSAA